MMKSRWRTWSRVALEDVVAVRAVPRVPAKLLGDGANYLNKVAFEILPALEAEFGTRLLLRHWCVHVRLLQPFCCLNAVAQ